VQVEQLQSSSLQPSIIKSDTGFDDLRFCTPSSCNKQLVFKIFFSASPFSIEISSVCNVNKTENSNANLDISGTSETSSQNIRATENNTTPREEQISEISIEKGEAEKNILKTNCLLQEEGVQNLRSSKPVSLFMMEGWRDELCNCSTCTKMYQELSLDFLIDPEDTVHY
jgi:hypothetical protein